MAYRTAVLKCAVRCVVCLLQQLLLFLVGVTVHLQGTWGSSQDGLFESEDARGTLLIPMFCCRRYLSCARGTFCREPLSLPVDASDLSNRTTV